MGYKRGLTGPVIGTSVVAALSLLLQGDAVGQVKIKKAPPLDPGIDPATQYSAIKLIEKSEFRQYINVARDCIADEAWNDAVTALQTILDNKEDFYVQVRD